MILDLTCSAMLICFKVTLKHIKIDKVGKSVNKGRCKNIFTLYYKLDLETLDVTNTI